MRRGWLLLIGLVLGLAGGLVYTWVINPVEYVDTVPWLMRADYRAEWIRMTALAYGAEGNLERTRLRLQELPEAEIQAELARTLDSAVTSGRSVTVLRRLATLAQAYGVDTKAVRVYTGQVEPTPMPAPTTSAPTPTRTPPFVTPTSTLPPLPTTTATPLPPLATTPYSLVTATRSCLPQPVIAVSVTAQLTATTGRRQVTQTVGVPGLELWLLSSTGADRAVTGLRPAVGLGYADFTVTPGERYNLHVRAPTGAPVAVVAIERCLPEDGGEGWSSWLLTIRQLEQRP